MSRAVSTIVDLPGKIIGGAVDLVSGVVGGNKPDAPAPAPAADAGATGAKEGALGATDKAKSEEKGPADAAIAARTKDFETRAQAMGQRAAAAGVTRSDNEADLLGYAAPKRKSASRSILG